MFVFSQDCSFEDLGNGARRKILAHSGNMMQLEVHLKTGAAVPMHKHPHEQLTYILSGEFKFTIGDETQIVKAGDTLYKEPNILHGCVCLKEGVLLDTFTPQREDFLRA